MTERYTFDGTDDNKNSGDWMVLVNRRRTNVTGDRREEEKA